MSELKEWFNDERYQHIATLLQGLCSSFDGDRFLISVLAGNEDRSLKERLSQTAIASRECLPGSYTEAGDILRQAAPGVGHEFVCIFIQDFFARYGRENPAYSLEAIREVTPFASGEFAIREFLRDDLRGTLNVMKGWANDDNVHVRRLACEGCRPRLPWSFHLKPLMQDPRPVKPILDALKADPEKYVQRSVANHLNDITKDHSEWMLDLVDGWDMGNPATAWIVKHASRNLIKQGHARAFALFGFAAKPKIEQSPLTLSAGKVTLGQSLELSFSLTSIESHPQKLAVDYAVYYMKKNGSLNRKVFKLSECTLGVGETRSFSKSHRFQNFTTRVHYAGRHEVAILINGQEGARHAFDLVV